MYLSPEFLYSLHRNYLSSEYNLYVSRVSVLIALKLSFIRIQSVCIQSFCSHCIETIFHQNTICMYPEFLFSLHRNYLSSEYNLYVFKSRVSVLIASKLSFIRIQSVCIQSFCSHCIETIFHQNTICMYLSFCSHCIETIFHQNTICMYPEFLFSLHRNYLSSEYNLYVFKSRVSVLIASKLSFIRIQSVCIQSFCSHCIETIFHQNTICMYLSPEFLFSLHRNYLSSEYNLYVSRVSVLIALKLSFIRNIFMHTWIGVFDP